MNNYLLEGENLLFINKEIDKLINNGFNDSTISKYDIEDDFLIKLLEDLDTYSLFSNKKVIIVNNIDKLTSNELDLLKNDLKRLYKYLDNPNNDNLLIFTITKSNSLSLIKKLKEKTTYKKIETKPIEVIKESLKEYKITSNNINYLIELCDEDIYKIINECEKLKTYCIDKKEITKEDIDLLVIKKVKETKNIVFDFTRSLLERNNKEALYLYKELINEGNDAISIIGLIATNLRTLIKIKTMESLNYSRSDIAKELGKKDFYVQKQQELTRIYSINNIINCIKELQEVDIKIKSTDLDKNILLEMYIINIK